MYVADESLRGWCGGGGGEEERRVLGSRSKWIDREETKFSLTIITMHDVCCQNVRECLGRGGLFCLGVEI